MPITGRMQEAIRRMESGESPEAIEAEMGDLFDEEGDPSQPGDAARRLARRLRPPKVDETLYDL